MANPITWRTVTGPSLADASRPLALAQLGINQGFDKLGQMIAERQAVNQGAVDRTDEANVQSFLDTVGKAQTPEEVAALRASGQLDALRQTINPKHLARVRGADEAREASLMQQMAARNVFNDQSLDREQATDRDAIASMIASGDFTGARTALSSKNLRNESVLEKALADAQAGRTKTELDTRKINQDILSSQAQAAYATAQAKQIPVNAQNTAFAKLLEQRREATNALVGGTGSGQGGSGPRNDGSGMYKMLDSVVKDEGTKQKLASVAGALRANPAYTYMTDQEIVGIALQSQDTRGTFARTLGFGEAPPTVEGLANAFVNTPMYVKREADASFVDEERRDDLKALNAVLFPGREVKLPPSQKDLSKEIPSKEEAAAIIRGEAPPAPAPNASPEQKLRSALPDYNGKAITNESVLDKAASTVSNLFGKIEKASQKNNAQSTAILIKNLLDNSSYIDSSVLNKAQIAAKQHPELFDPKVLDWLGQAENSKKKVK